MTRRALRGLAFVAVLSALGCTTVGSISISQIPEKDQRHNVVRGEGWSPIILSIPFGSGYVDDARAELLARCPNGAIEGVLAKFETHDFFFALFATQNVLLEGYCLSDKGGTAEPHRHKKG